MDHPDCFKVALNRHGEQATYARVACPSGMVIYTLRGEATGTRSRESIQVGPGRHVVDGYAQFINHSFSPNLAVRGRDLVAIRDIIPGEEVTFNYLESESEISCPFVCHDTGQPVDSGACAPAAS
ncbi:MAG: SET domain-containing protein [Akkermansiaceae bacterium]|nr:SET domain-containing protein [Akkermansiaceae bacterium]NNM28019.1 SET domain-containing protein [Akkermansiaceae bacterium]